MKLETKKQAALVACAVAVVVLAAPAYAKPVHKSGHRHHAARMAVQPKIAKQLPAGGGRDDRYSGANAPQAVGGEEALASASSAGEVTQSRRRAAQSHSNSAYGGATSNSLVSEARKYIGGNPTGRGSQWCGAFMDLVLKRTGHNGGGNLARAYAKYGTRVSGPQVGAIAVMNHHVGVVSGVDSNGNPIIVSGNHNRTVAESVYPRGRIMAYVMPGG
jgi:uncharacterized protein (TIGR02594 family)